MNLLLLALACAHTPETPVIDLSTPPPVAEVPDFTPPIPTEHTLANGIRVWIIERPGLPLVSLRVVVPGGSAHDGAGAWGASSLADEMLSQGAGERDANEFAREVERLALSLGAQTTGTATIVSLDSQTKTLTSGIALLADMVFQPHFDEADFARVRDLRIGQLKEANDDATTVAGWVIDQRYFGADHPLSHPVEGTLASVQSLTLADVSTSWQSRLGLSGLSIVVAGDVKANTILAALETKFAAWDGSASSPAPAIPAPVVQADDKRMFFVHKPGTSQTSLQVMMPAPAAIDPLAEAAELGAIVLGGTFTSRLNRKLREEKGYTYGARARYSGKKSYGVLSARTNVQNEVAAPALVDLRALLTDYANGIDADELRKAQGAWQTRSVASMESRRSIAGNYAALAAASLPASTLADELVSATRATVDDVNTAILRSKMEDAIVVVAGDLDVIRPALEDAFPNAGVVVEATP